MSVHRPVLNVDFVSDVVCPWCAIGLCSLEIALQRLDGEVDVTLRIRPFELNRHMAPEGEGMVEHLRHKYGMTDEQAQRNGELLRERARAVGFVIDPDARSRIWNTFDAHRVLYWAGTVGAAPQRALKHALMRAYHGAGKNPAQREVLLQCAAEAGLDAGQAAMVFDRGEFGDAVRAQERRWHALGIEAVPSVIVEGRHLIQGGQPPDVFEQALRRIAFAGPTT